MCSIPNLIEYLILLYELKDGEEIVSQGRTFKRIGNQIWELYYDEKDFHKEDKEEV